MRRLNLGCSDSMHPDFINVDIFRPPTADDSFVRADLNKRFEWEDSSVDEVRAHDILEHLRSKFHTMNEIHRILRPGGILDLFVPTTDGRGAFQDPTHVTWWTPNDLFYFCHEFAEWKRFAVSYGIKAKFQVEGGHGDPGVAWQIVNKGHAEFPNKVWKLRVRLEAIK